MACAISSSVACGLPSRRFSATDIENSVGSSNAVATVCRSADSDSSRMSLPSMRIAPSVTSYSRDSSAASTDFPEPVGPTSATVSPGSTTRLTCRSAQSSPRHRGTGSRRRSSSSRPPPRRLAPWAVLDLARRVEDLGDPVRRGERLLRHRQQEAQRGDGPHQRQHHRDERDERAHRHVAVARRVGAEAEHDDQRQVRDDLQQRPELRRHRHPADLRVVQVGELSGRIGRTRSRSRPNDLTTRTPSADSSTWVATWPDWSCASRDSRVYSRWKCSTVSGDRHDRHHARSHRAASTSRAGSP